MSIATCPDCARPLDATAACLSCAMKQALEAAALTEGGGLDASAVGFGSVADPVLPMQMGRFKLLRHIESGGMGVVYEAEDTVLSRVVALKMIRAFRFASKEEQQRFDLEARAAARLDHPDIVPVFDVGEFDGHAFLSMKFISGKSLAVRLKSGRMEAREAAALLVRLARAVQHAHDKGVLHRDLKPSNVLIDTQDHPWLIDFGMARLSDAMSGITLTGVQIGTPAYMSPEQAAGRNREIGPASDVWALGAMLYQMLTGCTPFNGENHLAIIQAVLNAPVPIFMPATTAEAGLAAILARCLEKDPVRRLGSAGELADELERWLAGETIQSRPLFPREKNVGWGKWHSALVLSLVVVLLAVFLTLRKDAGASSFSTLFPKARLAPPDGPVAATFGRAIAIEGDTMLVGAPLQGAGVVHVYQRLGGGWMEQAVLTAQQAAQGDEFGRAVALHGDTAVIGAHLDDQSAPDSGAAYVFARSGQSWAQVACLKAASPHAKDGFGRSVAVHGGTIVVGARLEDGPGMPDAGAAYVFAHEGPLWAQQARLTSAAPGPLHLFGISVCVENDTILVGADGEGFLEVPRHYYSQQPPTAGAVYAFTRSGGAWVPQSRLTPAKGCGGCFGYSVALSGDTALIGAYRDNSGTSGINTTPDVAAREAGAAFVFVREGTSWKQQAYLKPHHNGAGNRFGFSVALQNDLAVVGAYAESSQATGIGGAAANDSHESGAAYVFQRGTSGWAQSACLKPAAVAAYDHFGISTGITGGTVVIGASDNDRAPFRSGQVWIFRLK